MNELRQLESLRRVLPTPLYMVGAVLFGILGYIAFRRGRKTAKRTLIWTGIVMMLFPYLVPETWLLWLLGVVLCVWAYLKWN